MTRSAFALIFALVFASPLAAQTNTETVDKTFTIPPGGMLRLKTFSGRVKITGGSGDQVGGRFESDLPVTLTNSSRRNFRGALNGGGSGDFRLKTFSGSVSIRR